MAFRHNYWSCSKFASWLLTTFGSTPKPGAATAEEWSDWRASVRKEHPVVYWVTEEALDGVQNFLYWPYDKMKNAHDYIFNRYVSKSHILRTGLKPGEYNGVEEQLFGALGTLIQDFIEVEKAWHHCACDDKARAKFGTPWTFRRFSFSEWRCPEAGLELLEWEIGLKMDEDWGVEKDNPEYGKPTGQALRAMEQKRLYLWWTKERLARKDPYEESGWSEWCNRKREDGGDSLADLFGEKTEEEQEESSRRLLILRELEEKQEKEDEEFMYSVIKIRSSLRT